MKATITWWELSRSNQTIESLRQYLEDEGVAPWQSIPGMTAKFWISDQHNNLWGAVVVWDSAEAMIQELPPNRAKALIGHDPDFRMTVDVEVLVDAHSSVRWKRDLHQPTAQVETKDLR